MSSSFLSSLSSLSFTISIPTNVTDILALMTWCKKRGYSTYYGSERMATIGKIYLQAILEEEDVFSPHAFLDAHGKDTEMLDYMLVLQEEDEGHWESEFLCWEPDHPECARIEMEWMKSRLHLEKVKAFRDAVLAEAEAD